MKRFELIIASVVFLLFFSQCKKKVVIQSEKKVDVSLYVEDCNNSKTDITSLNVTWEVGDKLYVVGETDGLLGSISAQNNGSSAYFTGTIKSVSTSQYCRYYYIGDNDKTLTLEGDLYTYNIAAQYGTLDDIEDNLHLMHGRSNSAISVGQTNLGEISMTSMMSIANMSFVRTDGMSLGSSITCNGGFYSTKLNVKNGTLAEKAIGSITLNDVNNGNYYLALIPGTQTLTMTQDVVSNSLLAKEVLANTFYNVESPFEISMDWGATVSTAKASDIHHIYASCGGNIVGTGFDEKGVCVVESSAGHDPTITDKKYISSDGNTAYSCVVDKLEKVTSYKVRAYVKRGEIVKYGEVEEFTTEPIDWVDLGLPSGRKWATCNLGADEFYEDGDYYRWGDIVNCTSTDINCVWSTYKYWGSGDDTDGNPVKLKKYCRSNQSAYWYPGGTPDGKTTLDAEDDCVQQALGHGWHIPTQADWQELCDNTNKEWGAYGDHGISMNAWKFTSKNNSNCIYFRAAGYRAETYKAFYDEHGNYWSNSLYDDSRAVLIMDFNNEHVVYPNHFARYAGCTVRAVK